MAYGKSEVSGLGGWLALFIVTFAVIVPIAPIYEVVRSFFWTNAELMVLGFPGWLSYRVAAAAFCGVQVALCWIVTWRLFRVRRWSSVRLAILGMLIVLPGFVVLDMLATTLFFDVPISALPRDYAAAMLRASGYCTIWIAYFLRSQRVANTYPRPTDEDRLTAVFS